MNTLEARRRLLGRNVYKRTTEGNPAIAQGSLARRYPGITMQGWTEQNGTPTPETPVPIVSAGTQNQDAGKWEYEVKLTGKNMLPRYDSPSDWMPGGYSYIPIHGFIVGETYTASQQNLPEAGENFYVSIGTYAGNANAGVQHWLYHKSGGNLTKKSVSFKATQEVYYLNVADISSNGVTIDSAKLDKFLELFPDLMLEIGSEPTEYTPYQEQAVTLTAERPLTKWDRLEKRNGQWGWVYKSAEIESYTDESVPGEYFSTTGQLSTGAQVWYETTTETFVPLTASEQEAMNALYTFRPTTVLSNDCECEMTLTYKTKKSLEVTD